MTWTRPANFAPPFPEEDAALLEAELKKLGAKSVLEFGPGESTEMLAKMGLQVTTCEHDSTIPTGSK